MGRIPKRVSPHKLRHTFATHMVRAGVGLVDVGYEKHFRVQHGRDQFARGRSHINGIESFWGFAKRRLARFNGIRDHTFYLHLRECELRFNHRRANLYATLLKLLRNDPI